MQDGGILQRVSNEVNALNVKLTGTQLGMQKLQEQLAMYQGAQSN